MPIGFVFRVAMDGTWTAELTLRRARDEAGRPSFWLVNGVEA